jgi:hypothetical protein
MSDGAQGRAQAVQLPLDLRARRTVVQMRTDHLRERAVERVKGEELTIDEGIQVHPDVRAIGEGRRGGVGREVLSHLSDTLPIESPPRKMTSRTMGQAVPADPAMFGLSLRCRPLVIVTGDTLASTACPL